VTVIIKHIEIRQGPNTVRATLVSEELDAAGPQMRAEVRRMMNSNANSCSECRDRRSRRWRQPMRSQSGAAARRSGMAAARKWGVPTVRDYVSKRGISSFSTQGHEAALGLRRGKRDYDGTCGPS